MSCKTVFSKGIADLFKGSFKDDFIARLQAKGVSQATIDKYLNDLDPAIVKAEDIEEALEKAKIDESIQEGINDYYDLKKDTTKSIEDGYNPQNAKSGFELKEPSISSKVKVKEQDPLIYRPFKKSWIKVVTDKIANMMIVNYKKFSVQFLHYKSKTQLKIDKDGNVTLYIKGDFKQVVEGNYALEVKGDRSIKVRGDDFLTIGKNYKVDTGKEYNLGVGKGWIIQTGATTELTASDMKINNDVSVKGKQDISSTLKVGATISDMLGNLTMHKHDVVGHSIAKPR
jgi:hypothetical protein